jgi:DNA repair exonuclease SbcCD nuclease subunit
MAFVFFSDAHLQMQAWKDMPGVKGDAFESLSQVVQFCVSSKVEALIDGGDLFDGQPSAFDAYFLLNALEELKKANVKVYSIQGQHGRDRALSWACIDPYVTNLESAGQIKLAGGKVVVQGFDNSPSEELKAKLETVKPETNVLVLHQKASGVTPGMGSDFDTEWVDCHIRLVLLGDYHRAIEWTKDCPPPLGPAKYVYNGSLCMQAVDEPPEKSFLLVNDDLTYKRIPLVTRQFAQFSVQAPEQLEELLKQLKTFPDNGMVFVRFDVRVKDVEETIRRARPNLNLKCRPLPLVEVDTTKLLKDSVSVETCLATLVDREKQSELFAFTHQLINSKDVRGVLEEWRKRIL